MRALTINETINFQKKRNPKKTLDVGGIDLWKEYKEMKKRQENEWKNYLNDLLVGKTVSGNMLRVNYTQSLTNPTFDNGEFTFKVKSVTSLEGEERISFIDANGKYAYAFSTAQEKLWINESLKFEKTRNPRKTLDIGGVILSHEFEKFKEKFNKEWQEYLEKLFLGKTIEGKFRKFEMQDTGFTKPVGWGNWIVKVKKIMEVNIKDDEGFMRCYDENDNIYLIPFEKDHEEKIYISK